MKILLLIPSFADPGGTQKVVSDLGTLLAGRHEVYQCSFDPPGAARAFVNEIEVLSLGVKAPVTLWQKLTGYVLRAYRLNRLKKKHAIELTISNLWPCDFINALSSGRGKRFSICHTNIVGNPDNAMLLKHRRLVAWIYRRFHRIVAVEDNLARELAALYALPAGLFCSIPNFVTFAGEVAGAQLLREDRRRIGWCGRLQSLKNLVPLFSIFKSVQRRIPELQLVVIGEGPQRQEMAAAAVGEGLKVSQPEAVSTDADVLFVGFQPPHRYLSQCELFTHTSLTEGFGMVLVEAMAAGLPVLASDCPAGGPHSIMQGTGFRPGRADAEETPFGYLLPVPHRDDAGSLSLWERALLDLLEQSGKRAAKAENALLRAADYSREKVAQKWFDLLESV